MLRGCFLAGRFFLAGWRHKVFLVAFRHVGVHHERLVRLLQPVLRLPYIKDPRLVLLGRLVVQFRLVHLLRNIKLKRSHLLVVNFKAPLTRLVLDARGARVRVQDRCAVQGRVGHFAGLLGVLLACFQRGLKTMLALCVYLVVVASRCIDHTVFSASLLVGSRLLHTFRTHCRS